MKNLKTFGAAPLLAIGLTLAGCMGGGGTVNQGLETVHQPVVSRIDYTLDLRASGGGLAPGESGRLSSWFNNLDLVYGDRVSIDDRSGYNIEARETVSAQAAAYGLLLGEGAPVTTGTLASDSVRVVVSRMTAAVPGCPDWSRDSHPEFEGATMSNFGCATSTNLAAMIANPEDLITGRKIGTGNDSNVSTRAIGAYRAKPPTGAQDLKREDTKGE